MKVRPPLNHGLHRFHEGLQSLPSPGGGTHHWSSQPLGEAIQIDLDPVFPGLVHQIDAHHCFRLDLHDLKHQSQAPLQTGGIAHHHGGIGSTEAQ